MTIQQMRRRLGFWSLRLFAITLSRLAPTKLSPWGSQLGVLDYHLRPRLRQDLIKQLTELGRIQHHPQLTHAAADILKTAYQTNDRALLEIMALYASPRPPTDLLPNIHLEERSNLGAALERGRGVILVGMHMGNGVAMAAHINTHIAPVHVVYRESNKVPVDFFKNGLKRLTVSPIGTHGTDGGVRAMMRALKQNHIVYLLLDQGVKRPDGPERFLEKPFALPPGPVALAERTGAAIVPSLLTGVGQTGWTFRFEKPILTGDSDTIDQLSHQLIELMETHIYKHPQWWSWHQRRWAKLSFDTTITGER